MQELAFPHLPPRLADLEDPPQRLYLEGVLPRGPAVAIVGTRRPSPEAVEFTRCLASELATAGVAILSGGALGIDTAAHEGALEVGGVTVVVTVPGIARPYPEKNAALFRRIVAAGGAYLSLFPEHGVANRGGFFARNACLVALSHAVIVSQTNVIGGARNAASWARRLERPLFVVPQSPWVRQGKGAILELRLGGRPLDGSKDMLTFLRDAGLHAIPTGPRLPSGQGELWPEAGAEVLDPVLRALKEGAVHTDEIVDRTGLSLATVQQRILTLALSGVLVPGPLGSLKLVTA